MPELPEVETIRRGLSDEIRGKKIARFEVLDRKVIAGKEIKQLVGEKITGIARRGKLLIFNLSSPDKFLLIHLKMTGQLLFRLKNLPLGDPPQGDKHTRAIFYFSRHKVGIPTRASGEDSRLFFNDLRRFGYIKIVDKKELEKIIAEYGPEPLGKDFTLKYLSGILKKTGQSVKAALLDQKKIAGIGNIYADEACFCARVKPSRRASSLTRAEVVKLYGCIKKILALAIKYRGTTFSDYCDVAGAKGNFTKFLKVYDRAGEKCSRCGATLVKKKIAGRGSVFCPVCQK